MAIDLVRDFRVDRVQAADETKLQDGVLSVDCGALREAILQDSRIQDVQVRVIAPGESVRLIHVLDAVMPITAGSGAECAFPGFIAPADSLGEPGQSLNRLLGVLVTAMGKFHLVDGLHRQMEGIVDMTGRGQDYSPLGAINHVALSFEFESAVLNEAREGAIHSAMLATAVRLAAVTHGSDDVADVSDQPGPWSDGPRIVHISQVTTGGPLYDTFIAGKRATGILPTFTSGRQLANGLVICGDYRIAGHRNLTCFYQDDPILKAVAQHPSHPRPGMVILVPVGTSDTDKARSAALAAEMARDLGADGAVISAATAGNAHVDVILLGKACKRLGLPNVLVFNEQCGTEGTDQQMILADPSADLIISTGNYSELIELPAMDDVFGGMYLFDRETGMESTIAAGDELTVSASTLLGATTEIGAAHLQAVAS